MALPFHLDSFNRDVNQYPNPCAYVVNASQVTGWFKSRTTKALADGQNERPLSLVKSVTVTVVSIPYPRPSLFATQELLVLSIDAASVITIDEPAPPDGTIILTGVPRFGLLVINTYYVINSAGNTFQLSLTPGGPAVTLTPATPLSFYLYVMTPSQVNQLEAAKMITLYPNIYLQLRTREYKDVNLLQTINSKLSTIQFVLVLERCQFSDSGEPIWLHYKSAIPEQVYRFDTKDELNVEIQSRNGNPIEFFIDEKTTQGYKPDPYKQTLITFSVLPYLKDGHFTNQAVDLVGE